MVTLPGRGFDSRQLHWSGRKQAPPEGGFCFWKGPKKARFLKGIWENKKTMRSMVIVFYLQDWNQGTVSPTLMSGEHPRQLHWTEKQSISKSLNVLIHWGFLFIFEFILYQIMFVYIQLIGYLKDKNENR